jgi:phosphoglycolate phosphatase
MMAQQTKAVIFDFDYTLADSSKGVIECVNYALAKMHLPAPPPERVRKTIGLSMAETFKRLTGTDDQRRTAEYIRWFTEQSDKVMLAQTVILAAARPALTDLHQRGLLLGIVSTKFRYRIEAFLEREKLRDAFQVIIGGEDVSVHKPDPTGLLKAMSEMKCSPQETLYVGDSTVDAETAHRARTPFAAVLTGVTPAEMLAEYQPLATINTLEDLGGLINRNAGSPVVNQEDGHG